MLPLLLTQGEENLMSRSIFGSCKMSSVEYNETGLFTAATFYGSVRCRESKQIDKVFSKGDCELVHSPLPRPNVKFALPFPACYIGRKRKLALSAVSLRRQIGRANHAA